MSKAPKEDERNYTLEELRGMSRVQLRRAAIEVLNMDNKEASNTKSGDLIEKILDRAGDGDGDGEEEKAPPKRTRKSRKTSSRKAPDEDTSTKGKHASANDISTLVDAVGKAVDETKETLNGKVEEVMENQEQASKQQFILYGLLCDIYKMMEEPDVLERRLNELDKEWDAQEND